MILCLGEGLVDLICERPVRSLAEADSFTPHFGGALANVAVAVARAGGPAALAGAAGDDEWGSWLRDRLEREGVDLTLLRAARGRADAGRVRELRRVARAVVPDLRRRGRGRRRLARAARSRRRSAAASGARLQLDDDGDPGRARGDRPSPRARPARGARVCFDPNIRPNRWGGEVAPAAEVSRELIPGTFLFRSNDAEARAIAGVDDPRLAAERIAALGAELAVVTLGADGVVVRGACEAELPAPGGRRRHDARRRRRVHGHAGRRAGGPRVGRFATAEALPAALDAAAEACARWSALD